MMPALVAEGRALVVPPREVAERDAFAEWLKRAMDACKASSEHVARETGVHVKDVNAMIRNRGWETRKVDRLTIFEYLLKTLEGPRPVAPSTDRQELRANARLSERWVLSAPIGHGGYGDVWEVRDQLCSGLLLVAKFANPGRGEALRSEYVHSIRHKLNHPNVCKALHYGEDRELGPYLLFEHGGKALSGHDYFETRRCAADEAIAIAEQVAAGLDYLHAREIFHGDISPDNLLIERDETSERRDLDVVRICDLGIARGAVREQVGGRTTLVADHSGAHKRKYASPEQLLGKKLRRQSDQYSFARTIHAILIGVEHFESPSRDESSDDFRLDHSAYLRATSLSPDDRFPSCRDFVAALRGSG